MTWQPISTAPKDETQIMLCDASDPDFFWVKIARWYSWASLGRGGWWDGEYSFRENEFTHWQPVPERPDAAARGG